MTAGSWGGPDNPGVVADDTLRCAHPLCLKYTKSPLRVCCAVTQITEVGCKSDTNGSQNVPSIFDFYYGFRSWTIGQYRAWRVDITFFPIKIRRLTMRFRAKVIVAALVMIPGSADANTCSRRLVRRIFRSWRHRKLRFPHV